MAQIEWTLETPGIEIAQANSAGEFMDALRRSNSQWWSDGQMPWVFRGHRDKAWPLLPSAWRPTNGVIADFASAVSLNRLEHALIASSGVRSCLDDVDGWGVPDLGREVIEFSECLLRGWEECDLGRARTRNDAVHDRPPSVSGRACIAHHGGSPPGA
ncbi:hypothetical protein [Bradyrhizobium sp. AS23.2]|uniref:hypothetical protein n=1 Tax=Bradyrhizobium sp. AS23.2 TaxID=1680155 RepID=UPI00095DA263|nr:hypothetical protein [Bradyrhizobium sp. AS23.2]OKO68937.1 hypothetical protein AC630_37835 [Bradyrhizobium sp. AS23.2]